MIVSDAITRGDEGLWAAEILPESERVLPPTTMAVADGAGATVKGRLSFDRKDSKVVEMDGSDLATPELGYPRSRKR